MGWSGPGSQRRRGTRVGHACGGGTSLPGWLESAGRLRSVGQASRRPARFSERGEHACGSGGWAADTRVMRQGTEDGTVRFRTRAALTIAKSILIDQLNVAMTSIRFRTTRRCARRASARVTQARRRIGEILRTERQRVDQRWRNGNGQTCAAACRCNWRCRLRAGKVKRRESMPTRRAGLGHELREGVKAPVLPAMAARLRPPGRLSDRVPTRRARRCASRAPCRARGDQSQSRWWRCLR